MGRTSPERLFACCGPKGAAEACQLSRLAAGLRTAVMTLCSGSAPLRVRVLCEQPHFVSAAPPSADWSSRPGSRNPRPGLQPRPTRGLWRGKGYTSSHAASGLETLAIAEARQCDILVAIPSSFDSISVTAELLLTTGLVGPLRKLSAGARQHENKQPGTWVLSLQTLQVAACGTTLQDKSDKRFSGVIATLPRSVAPRRQFTQECGIPWTPRLARLHMARIVRRPCRVDAF